MVNLPCLRFVQLLSLTVLSSGVASAQNLEAAKLNAFSHKDLQITVLKNPGSIIKTGFLGSTRVDDQLVIVRVQGKVVRTYVTSTARPGKTTPDGIYLAIDRCRPNHTSNIYGSEMDWALFLDQDIAIHSTTEDHYQELGRPASAGCMRLLRDDAKELFQFATGAASTPGLGTTQDYVSTNQIGINILPEDKVKAYWDSLSKDETKIISKMAVQNRKKIDTSVKTFYKHGDKADDVLEETFQTPQGRALSNPKAKPSSRFKH